MEETPSLINGEASFNGLGFNIPSHAPANIPFSNGQDLLPQHAKRPGLPMTLYGYPADIAARNLAAQHAGLVGVDGLGSGSLGQVRSEHAGF